MVEGYRPEDADRIVSSGGLRPKQHVLSRSDSRRFYLVSLLLLAGFIFGLMVWVEETKTSKRLTSEGSAAETTDATEAQ